MRLQPIKRLLHIQAALAFGLVVAGLAAAMPAAAIDPSASYIVIEAESGLVLSEHNADVKRPPASMVKMMHMLLVAEGLVAGAWELNTPITVSAHAQSMGGTQVYLRSGEVFPLVQLMRAIAVASANDAAMAVAEGLWGSETACLEAMNRRAIELGMVDTRFNSVHGLPPSAGHEFDQTTARDMALLARECAQHPLILEWTAQKELVFRPGESPRENTNKLIGRMEGCDGLKTGYIRAAGFCLTATATRNGIRLITVVMGTANRYARVNVAEELLEAAFGTVRRVTIVKMDERLDPPIPVHNSPNLAVALAAERDLSVIVQKDDLDKLQLVADLPPALRAPMARGERIGKMAVVLGEHVLAETALLLPVDLVEATWQWKLKRSVLRGRS